MININNKTLTTSKVTTATSTFDFAFFFVLLFFDPFLLPNLTSSSAFNRLKKPESESMVN